jgi:hypothetical protein
VTTLLELVGLALLVVMAAVVWWPAALGVAGVACLLVARQVERRQ